MQKLKASFSICLPHSDDLSTLQHVLSSWGAWRRLPPWMNDLFRGHSILPRGQNTWIHTSVIITRKENIGKYCLFCSLVFAGFLTGLSAENPRKSPISTEWNGRLKTGKLLNLMGQAYKSNLSIGHRETHKSSNFTLISQWCCRILVTWPKISSLRRIFEYPYENQNGHSSNKDTELLLPRVDSTGLIPYFTFCISRKSHQGSALHWISCNRK